VKVASQSNDKVSVDLAGLAPKAPTSSSSTTSIAKPTAPPPPPKGVNLKNGLLTIAGDPNTNNTVAVTLSKDGKSIDVTLDGKSSVFSASLVKDITVFDGKKNDTLSVSLGTFKLAHPVLVHGGFGTDVINGAANYDLPLAPPPPPATT
jgi:hypothetical protein